MLTAIAINYSAIKKRKYAQALDLKRNNLYL